MWSQSRRQCGFVEVIVIYNYKAQEDDELTLRVNDIIKDVTVGEGGWWTGVLNGKRGFFPDNFVQVTNNSLNLF